MGNPNILKIISNNCNVKQGTAAIKSSFPPKATRFHRMTNVYYSRWGTVLLFTPRSLPCRSADIWIRIKSQAHPLPSSSKARAFSPTSHEEMKLLTKLLAQIQNSQIVFSYTEPQIFKSVSSSMLKRKNMNLGEIIITFKGHTAS